MIDTWTADRAETDWTSPQRVALWNAINEYAVACGGDPATRTVSGRRMDAVVAVERAVRAYTHPAGIDDVRVVPVYVVGPPAVVPLVARPSFWVLLFAAVVSSFVYLLAAN